MSRNVTRQILEDHVAEGDLRLGDEIAIRIDQTLTQDATGTLVMLALEAMGLERARTQSSVQYVDHNLIQQDHKNPDDHIFLRSACERFGIWFSPPGNGVSHPVHQERFGKPGLTLLGSDSHTPAAGAMGMLAIGAGGLDVASAIAGEPYHLPMPKIWGIELTGALPAWGSAKDVILELLRRHGVSGGVGCVFEYFGSGLSTLSAMDRHVIANMGTELGATSSVFPSDEQTLAFLSAHGRGDDWRELRAEPDAHYDRRDSIDLSQLEPLIAMPSSPGNVVAVAEVAGEPIYQAYIGSSANPGYRDFAIAAEIVKGERVHPRVSFDINPSSQNVLARLTDDGHLSSLIRAGARIHQAGCNGCIGMGQAPATDRISLRTVPRNFPGRSGTREDKVCLVSPETAAVSALFGVITDPRVLDRPYPEIHEDRDERAFDCAAIESPGEAEVRAELERGPNIVPLPDLDPLPDELKLTTLLKVGDDVSTDEIMPAGTRVLPYRSNIPAISEFAFEALDASYADRARAAGGDGHLVVGGHNYGQGSSREHAALAPRFLGLRVVAAKSFARIHAQNLVNFGVLPVEFEREADYERIERDAVVRVRSLRRAIEEGEVVEIQIEGDPELMRLRHSLSSRNRMVLLAGGLLRWLSAERDRS